MTFKQFLTRSTVLIALGLLLILLLNTSVNEFGLMGNATGLKRKPISRDWERWAKYLYTYNYIPANFEGLIVGPSLSDNLNPELLENRRIYNASINGGNFTEVRLIAENVIEHNRNVKYLIICLDPYLTKDSGRKTGFLSEQDYWSALGSIDLYRYYYDKIKHQYRGLSDVYNEYGHYNFNLYKDKQDVEKAINAALKGNRKWGTDQFKIDEKALQDLKETVKLARENGLLVFAYYHPRPYEIYDQNRGFYEEFYQRLDPIFSDSDSIFDFNTPEYEFLSRDHSNYCDHCHLSQKGAEYMMKEIDRRITASLVSRCHGDGSSDGVTGVSRGRFF